MSNPDNDAFARQLRRMEQIQIEWTDFRSTVLTAIISGRNMAVEDNRAVRDMLLGLEEAQGKRWKDEEHQRAIRQVQIDAVLAEVGQRQRRIEYVVYAAIAALMGGALLYIGGAWL